MYYINVTTENFFACKLTDKNEIIEKGLIPTGTTIKFLKDENKITLLEPSEFAYYNLLDTNKITSLEKKTRDYGIVPSLYLYAKIDKWFL